MQRWLIAAALFVLAIVPYVQTRSHAFLTYDDPLYVTNTPMVQRGLTMEGVQWAFTTYHACNWHPLTWLSHMADVAVFDVNPGGPLMVNMALHAINTLLVWLMLWRMTGALWRGAVVAAVFAVHPLHVESVAWISERKDLLSTMFGLLAIACYIGYVRKSSVSAYALMLLCFAASLLSKPMLVTLPCVLLLLDYWPLCRMGRSMPQPLTQGIATTSKGKHGGKKATPQNRSAKPVAQTNAMVEPMPAPLGWPRLLIEKIPLFVMSIASSIVTVVAQSSGEAMQTLVDVPMAARLMNALIAYASYLVKFVWPANLAVFYPRATQNHFASVGLAVIVLLAITAFTIQQRRGRPWLAVGWLFFLGTLVPVIGLVQVGLQSMADRYMYVPMIGLLIMVVWSIALPRTLNGRVAWGGAAAVVIVWLSIVSSVQVRYWRNSVTLFQRAADVTPDNHVVQCNLGNAYLEVKRPDLGIPHLQKSLDMNPNAPLTHYDIGIAYQVTGRLDDAVAHYRRAIELSPTYAVAWANLSSTLTALKRYPEAIDAAEQAINNDPDLAEGYAWHGVALAASGDAPRAIPQLRRAIEIRGRAAKTRVNLAICLMAIGQEDQAIQELRMATIEEPDLVEARTALASALAKRGETAEAIAHLQHALRVKPSDPTIQQHLLHLQNAVAPGSGG